MSIEGTAAAWAVISLLVLIGLVAIFGNILLIYLVLSKPGLRENINYFVLSLASVDLLTALLIMPLQSYHSAANVTTEDALCAIINILAVMTALASVLSLLLVTVDRYVAIRKPLRYVTLVTVPRVFVAIACVWLYATSVSFLILIEDEVSPGYVDLATNVTSLSCNMASLIGLPYGYFLLCNFFLPIPVIFVVYGHIFFIARRHARAIHDMRRVSCAEGPAAAAAAPRPSLFRQEVRIAAVLFVITAYFFISWTATVVILAVLRDLPEYEFELTIAYKIIFYANAAINPFLYIFQHKALRSYFLKTLRRKLSRVGLTAAPSPLMSVVSLGLTHPRTNSVLEEPKGSHLVSHS